MKTVTLENLASGHFTILTLYTLMLLPGPAQCGGGEWCGTYIDFKRKAPKQLAVAGVCPTRGPADSPANRDACIPDANTPIKWIRIKFNVLRNDDGGNPAATQAEVDAQVLQLNNDFQTARIQFHYQTAFINSTQYRSLEETEIASMKNAHADQPHRQHNIFVVHMDWTIRGLPIAGLSTFPWDEDALRSLGGTILDDDDIRRGKKTLTHEIGHALGLWHTFHGVTEIIEEDGACSACYERADGLNADVTGDLCSETPATPVNFTCSAPPGTDPCASDTSWPDVVPDNHMGYSPETCRTTFTPQQMGRMHCWIRDAVSCWTGECNVICDSEGNLFSISLRGDTTPIFLNHTPQVMYDVAFDRSGQLCGIDGGSMVDPTSKLYRIDIRTGATIPVGSLGAFANGLEFREDGALFAIGDDRLYLLDTTTGVATPILDLPSQYQAAGDLVFDGQNNLYLTTQVGAILQVAPDLLAWHEVGNTGTMDIWGLIWGPDSFLYGFSDTSETMWRINPIDGSAAPVAVVSDPRLSGLYGAAADYRPRPSNQAIAPPNIAIGPTNVSTIVGRSAAFTVVAGGGPPLSYQWLCNGVQMPSATTPSLVFSTVSAAHAGAYQVVVRNTLGFQTSAPVTLTVVTERNLICDSAGNLFIINVRDGSTPVYLGQTPQVMFDLALDPSGELYGIDGGGWFDPVSKLYRIDIRTGASALVGSLGYFANGLEFRDDGALFANGGNGLYSVDRATGRATPLLTLPAPREFFSDIVFDEDNNLYSVTRDGVLVQINSSLTTWREIGQTGLADCWGLIYGLDHVLYGFKSGSEQICRIDLSTGVTTSVANITDVGVNGVYGAAAEFKAKSGTRPLIENITWRPSDTTPGTRVFGFNFPTTAEESYVILFKEFLNGSHLSDPVWIPLTTISGDGQAKTFFDEATSASRFYLIQKFRKPL